MKNILLLILASVFLFSSEFLTQEIYNRVKDNGIFYGQAFELIPNNNNRTTFSRTAFGNGVFISFPSNNTTSEWISTNGIIFYTNDNGYTFKSVTNLVQLKYIPALSSFIALYKYSDLFLYSTNSGKSWTTNSVLSAETLNWLDIIYNSNIGAWVALANETNYMAVSSNIDVDFNTNIATTPAVIVDFKAIAINFAGVMVMVGQTNVTAFATDPTNWNTNYVAGSPSLTNTNWIGVASDGTNFLANASLTNFFALSTSGSNWTYKTWTAVPRGSSYTAIKSIGSTFYTFPTGSTNFMILITNAFGTTAIVSNIGLPVKGNWKTLSYGNGMWVITGDTNVTLFTTNIWTTPFTSMQQLNPTGMYFLVKNSDNKPMLNVQAYTSNSTAAINGVICCNIYEGISFLSKPLSNYYVVASNTFFKALGADRNSSFYGGWYAVNTNEFMMLSGGTNIYTHRMSTINDYSTLPVQLYNNNWYLVEITNINLPTTSPINIKVFLYK